MSYRDTWATCTECGKEFVFTVEEQRRLDKLGKAVEPSLCKACQGGSAPAVGPGQGVVKWYDGEKGYGFIAQHTGDEIFFHRSSISNEDQGLITDGVLVAFEVEQTDRGPQAVGVKLVDQSQ